MNDETEDFNKPLILPVPKDNRRQLLEDRTEFVNKYNNKLLDIINAIYSKNKKEDVVIELKEKFLVAKREVPETIIVKTGPYLWEYRDVIKGKKESVLLNNDYKEDIQRFYSDTIPSVESYERIPHIINQMKRIWHLFTTIEKEVMWKCLAELLGYYASYIGICKRLKSL